MHLKWEFVGLLGLWLLLVQVRGDMDIRPELPEDFPRTTAESTAETATEPAQTESTAEAATEPATTTTAVDTTTSMAAEVTTSTPTTTTTAAAAAAASSSSTPGYPSFKPPSPWLSLPHLMAWLWENAESGGSSESGSEELQCYLKDQEEQSYYRFRCGHSGWQPTTNCYRCCYYGYSEYAGCSKLHEGRCSPSHTFSWLY